MLQKILNGLTILSIEQDLLENICISKLKAKPLDEVGSHLKQKSGRYNDRTTTTTCFFSHFPNL